MPFTQQSHNVTITDPRLVEYLSPADELTLQHDEAFAFYDQIHETPEEPTTSHYEQSARVMLVGLREEENWSFARLLRRAIISLITCLWSLSASVGRITDEVVKKKELLFY